MSTVAYNSQPVNTLDYTTFPAEICELPQWVVWKLEKKNNRNTKVPYDAKTHKRAATDKPQTWAPFKKATEVHQKNRSYAGIGFVFTKDDPYVFIDMDHCRNPQTGEIDAWARQIIDGLNTYTEISQSGTGIHCIGKGKLPHGRNKTPISGFGEQAALEMYETGRYGALTGNIFEGKTQIEDCGAAITTLHNKHLQRKNDTPALPLRHAESPLVSDSALIERAMKAKDGDVFGRLWAGDTSDFAGDESRADYHLCLKLAFWTRKDAARMDTLFRQSGLMREKWNREDYRTNTIDKAISDCTEVYTAPPHSRTLIQKKDGSVEEYTVTDSEDEEEDRKCNIPDSFFTEMGLADRFIARHGRDVCYIPIWKKWVIWTGKQWELDEGNKVKLKGKETIRSLYQEAYKAASDFEAKRIAKFASKSQTNSKVEAMISLARPDLLKTPDDFDQNQMLLNVQNGTIELDTGVFREHRREDFITKIANVQYRREEQAPTFNKFLNDITLKRTDLARYVQKLCGYGITGDVSEQILPIAWGAGNNGKSTLFTALLNILGGYATALPAASLMARKNDNNIPNDIAMLKGMRFVICSESEEGARLDESKIKQLTGGDYISARFLHAEFFTFMPTHKIFLFTNHKPNIRGTDEGIWRRPRLIPFEARVAQENETLSDNILPRDPFLNKKLAKESSGILNWLIEGCIAWQQEGLNTPECVSAQTQTYRIESDTLRGFLGEKCKIHENVEVSSADLWNCWKIWASENNEYVGTQKRLGGMLTERGFIRVRKRDRWYWQGIRLLTEGEYNEEISPNVIHVTHDDPYFGFFSIENSRVNEKSNSKGYMDHMDHTEENSEEFSSNSPTVAIQRAQHDLPKRRKEACKSGDLHHIITGVIPHLYTCDKCGSSWDYASDTLD